MATLAQATLTDAERRVLARWVELLAEQLDLVTVWLFGSRARGESGPGSDIDLLVIARGERPWKERDRAYDLIQQAAEELGESFLAYSIHLWDPPHLARRREIRSSFVQEVDRDKVVLHRDGLPPAPSGGQPRAGDALWPRSEGSWPRRARR